MPVVTESCELSPEAVEVSGLGEEHGRNPQRTTRAAADIRSAVVSDREDHSVDDRETHGSAVGMLNLAHRTHGRERFLRHLTPDGHVT